MKDVFILALSFCLLVFTYCHANGNYQVHSDGTITYIGSGFQDYNNEDVYNFDRVYYNKFEPKDLKLDYDVESKDERDRRHRNNSERSRVRQRSACAY